MLGKSIKDTWLIGEDAFKDGVGFLRDMSNPSVDGISTDYYPERLIPSCTCPQDDCE
jgi:Zn-dependent metalloprotease